MRMCEVCGEREASSFVKKKCVCRDCFEVLKQNKHIRVRKGLTSYKCSTCGKVFESKCKLIIPFCSRRCRDRHNRIIDRDIEEIERDEIVSFIQEISPFKALKGGVGSI